MVISIHDLVYNSLPSGGGLVIYGGSGVSSVSADSISGSEGILLFCSDPMRNDAGHYSRNAGDFNGDGIDDFAVGSPKNQVNSSSYIIFGSASLPNPYDVCNIPLGGGVSISSESTYTDKIGDRNIDSADLNGGRRDVYFSLWIRNRQ